MTNAAVIAAVAGGTGVGACVRYATDRLLSPRVAHVFPWATLVVNVVGSFVLGLVVALTAHHNLSDTARLIIGTGFCGGLTTFSTFAYENLRLIEGKDRAMALMYVIVSVVVGLGAAAIGLRIGA